jgi:CheY-like chemotaxis protein
MLAAEDNAVNKKLIPRLLAKAGFPLRAAGDGFLAVQAMAPRSGDAVLMDRQMPRVDGLEARSS